MSRFAECVGVRWPVQQAGMSGPATPELAAAVSATGALGMIGIGRQPIGVVERYLERLAELTTAPVGVTCIAHFVHPAVEELLIEHLPIVEFFYDWPDARRIRPGTIHGWQVGSVDEARAAADAGCSYVIAQGIEAGGHVRGTVPLSELVPAIRSAIDLPIVAAGGIATPADVRCAFALGADAVRVGTRFVVADESNAHPDYVDLLLAAGEGTTEFTEAFGVGWPDAPHRVLASSIRASAASEAEILGEMVMADGRVAPMPRFGVSVPTRETSGEIAAMALYAGTGVGRIDRRQTAAEIVADLVCGLTEPDAEGDV